jgi:serine/threonine-protein kinase RsbW
MLTIDSDSYSDFDSDHPSRTIEIDSQLTQVSWVSDAWHAFVSAHQLPIDSVAPFELALVEWINNVIEHAYEMKEGHPITIRLMWDGQTVHAFVCDQGHALPRPSLQQQRDAPEVDETQLDDLPEGGWGLFLIQHICDKWQYTSSTDGNQAHLALTVARP